MSQQRITVILLILIASLLTLNLSHASECTLTSQNFASIIILDHGRKKPIDTYARNTLLQISGKETFHGKSAPDWLLKVVMTPEKSEQDSVFLVQNPELLHAMGLAHLKARRLSYRDLENGLDKLTRLANSADKIEKKKQNALEAESIRLYNNLRTYVLLGSSLHFSFPIKTHKEINLYKIIQNNPEWKSQIQKTPFAIFPVVQNRVETWLSPWESLDDSITYSKLHACYQPLIHSIQAYRTCDAKSFNTSISKLKVELQHLNQPFKTARFPNLEMKYNQFRPFFYAKWIYLLVLALAFFSQLNKYKIYEYVNLAFLLSALLIHTWGLACRILIMNRPPVTNLFETFIFVAWITAVIGSLIAWKKETLGLYIASIGGAGLLYIANKYTTEGDTMGMLVAVLSSNFWLTTHVLTITMGYAGCIAAGIIGHIFLIYKARGAKSEQLTAIALLNYKVIVFGLLLSFVGTVLGGIWADQSWGRFWGWDPKENGALLIVLWCSLLLHARGKFLNDIGFAIGSILGTIVVAFAWFGVNLLGLGLHSYGFSAGVFYNLLAFSLAETMIAICAVWYFFLRKNTL